MPARRKTYGMRKRIWLPAFCGLLAISTNATSRATIAHEDNELLITQSRYLDEQIALALKSYAVNDVPEPNIISDVVIDPKRLFVSLPYHFDQLRSDRSKFYWTDLDITLKYRGDDYAFPVMGMALVKITEKTGDTQKKIRDFWIARAVRSPLPSDGFDRPRTRGREAVSQYKDFRDKNPGMSAREIISSIPFEHLETSSVECQQISDVLSQLTETTFISGDLEFYPLHSDSIELTVRPGPGYRITTYEGWVENSGNTPGAWAVNLLNAIDSCWRAVPAEQFDQFNIPE